MKAIKSLSHGGVVNVASDNNWAERTVTWNNAPAVSVTMATIGAVAEDAWTDVDITTFINSDGTYSFRLNTPVDDKRTYDYRSREEGSSSAPYIMLTLSDI